MFVSDNETQFTSIELKANCTILKANGIIHKLSAPYHSATNGQAERYVRTIKEKLKALKCDKKNLHKQLCNILLNYRKMTHPTTNQSPAMMVFGRQIRSRMDLMLPSKEESMDKSNHNKARQFNIDDRVAVREYMSRDKWRFGSVIERTGDLHYMVRLDDGIIWKRHVNQMRKVGLSVHGASDAEFDDDDETDNEDNSISDQTVKKDTPITTKMDTDN